jgi:hypothetical protein
MLARQRGVAATVAARAAAVVVGVVALLAAPVAARALPRFAVRNGAHCTLCHVNPNGGGGRNDYGRDVFEKTRLAFSFLDPQEKAMAGDDADDPAGAPSAAEGKWRGFGLSGALTDWLAIGGDLRLAFLHVDKVGEDPITGDPLNAQDFPGDGFFLMQADVYVMAQLGRFTTFYVDKSVRGAGYEAWALYTHPGKGYVRAGHFTPSYGLRLEEHRAYVTEELGVGPLTRETGVEAGVYVGPFQLNLALGLPFSNTALATGARSASPYQSYGGYATLTFAHAFKDLSLVLGLSAAVRTHVSGPTPLLAGATGPTPCGVQELLAGGFLGASLGRFTYLAEADLAQNVPWVATVPPMMGEACGTDLRVGDASTTGFARGLAVYHELSFALLQGFDVVGTWEFKDPDLSLASGAETRFGAGFEFFFTANSEIKLMWRHRVTKAESFHTNGEDEVLVFAHLFF